MKRQIGRAAAILAVVLMVGLSAPPALALPKPRREQWWFGAWAIHTEIWPITTGAGITVAVIDTGVEARLADLKGVVLPGKNFFPGETDDARKDLDTERNGHGTAMAALIASQGRGTGMAGVAPGARILPLIDADTPQSQAAAIRYAADHGAKVINMSFAQAKLDGCPQVLQQAVAYAISRDVVPVAGAGNDGLINRASFSPANCAGVLAVGAVDGDKKIWRESSPGSYVMLAAPGVQVGSIGKRGRFTWNLYGTSQATALTSGAVALIRSKYPQMPGRQVVQRLIATALDVGPKGWDDRSGFGVILPHDALTKNVPATARNPVYERLDRWLASRADSPPSAPGSAKPGIPKETHKSVGSPLPVVALASGTATMVLLLVGFAVVRGRKAHQ